MTTTITLTQALAGHQQGDTITVTKGAAQFLTTNGYAEDTPTNPPTQPPTRRKKGGGASQAKQSATAG